VRIKLVLLAVPVTFTALCVLSGVGAYWYGFKIAANKQLGSDIVVEVVDAAVVPPPALRDGPTTIEDILRSLEPVRCEGGAKMFRVSLMTAYNSVARGQPLDPDDVVCVIGKQDVWVLEIAGYPRFNSEVELRSQVVLLLQMYEAGKEEAENAPARLQYL
jgi:hypothetical protein